MPIRLCGSLPLGSRAGVGGSSPTVLPGELSLDVATAGQGLHSLNDIEVLDGNLGVLGEVVAGQG